MSANHRRPRSFQLLMERFSGAVTEWTGSTAAFLLALGAVLLWLVTGPLFHFSDTWQLVINTATTVLTFLMVFLIQRAQNKSAKAMALKLNELIAAVEGASNRLIAVEDLSEEELATLHEHFQHLVLMAKRDSKITKSHSIEEAQSRHEGKKKRQRRGSMLPARHGRPAGPRPNP
jgi:low affinity Fe/Cu permease